MEWRRKWQPTPVFLPGESQGQRSLAGYSAKGPKELDTTEMMRAVGMEYLLTQHSAHEEGSSCCYYYYVCSKHSAGGRRHGEHGVQGQGCRPGALGWREEPRSMERTRSLTNRAWQRTKPSGVFLWFCVSVTRFPEVRPHCSKCCLDQSSGTPWKLVRNADSQAPPPAAEINTYTLFVLFIHFWLCCACKIFVP